MVSLNLDRIIRQYYDLLYQSQRFKNYRKYFPLPVETAFDITVTVKVAVGRPSDVPSEYFFGSSLPYRVLATPRLGLSRWLQEPSYVLYLLLVQGAICGSQTANPEPLKEQRPMRSSSLHFFVITTVKCVAVT